jgi:hypothetical protein
VVATTAGFGSGKSSFSNHVIAISTSMIAVKRRIIAPAAKQVPLYHGLSMAGRRAGPRDQKAIRRLGERGLRA